jgi:hypothetical protein
LRRKLIEADVIECVLGLGPNLFYNSPMEARVVICRAAKAKERRNKILFINAVNEVTRERAQSFLTDDHIARIVKAYEVFNDEPGFTRVVGLEEIRARDGNLNIPLYVSASDSNGQVQISTNGSLPDALSAWLSSANDVRAALTTILGTDALKETRVVGGKPAQTLPTWLKRNEWQRLPFGAFAQNINERVEPSQAGDEIYVGLEHLDPQDLHMRRWGKGSDVIGTKLRFRKGDLIFGRRRAYISDVYFADLRRYEVRAGDIIVAGLGDETHPVGRAALIPQSLGPAINKADCFCLRASTSVVSNAYLTYFLNSRTGRSQVEGRAQGTTRMRINVGNLKTIAIPVPSITEQDCIVSKLRQIESANEVVSEQIVVGAATLTVLVNGLLEH